MGLWVFGVVGVVLLVAVFLARRGGANEPHSFVCSACMQVHPFREIRVLPWWNASVQSVLTSFRCAACFPASVRETREVIATLDNAQRESFLEFLRNHKLDELAAQVEATDAVGARAPLGRFLDEIERGERKLGV